MVCLGNICRSPLAEGILKNKDLNNKIFVDSAGTSSFHIGKKPDIRSIEIAKKYGIDISSQRARQFTRDDFARFDRIYAMDKHNYSNLISLSNSVEEKEKINLILDEVNENDFDSIPDPYYGDGDGFQTVYNMLDKACNKIIEKI